jgi:hypothetical protein
MFSGRDYETTGINTRSTSIRVYLGWQVSSFLLHLFQLFAVELLNPLRLLAPSVVRNALHNPFYLPIETHEEYRIKSGRISVIQ